MSHKVSLPDLAPQVDRVLDALRTRNDVYLIAVVGIPGSGKSTLCEAIAKRMHRAVVLPMDGYHVPRQKLSAADIKRRGAPHTFDFEQLHADLRNLRQHHAGSFPAFDHAKKDPEPHAIHVTRDNSPILVEGNYLLLKEWELADMFDFKIFINCEIQRAMTRVQNRLVECQITSTLEEAIRQVQANDLDNANLILNDSTATRYDLILQQT